MKLLTDMVDFHGRVLPRNATHAAHHFSLEHDAACAHALMQAIGEIEPACAIYELHERADEIMAGWGFDSTPEQP